MEGYEASLRAAMSQPAQCRWRTVGKCNRVWDNPLAEPQCDTCTVRDTMPQTIPAEQYPRKSEYGYIPPQIS